TTAGAISTTAGAISTTAGAISTTPAAARVNGHETERDAPPDAPSVIPSPSPPHIDCRLLRERRVEEHRSRRIPVSRLLRYVRLTVPRALNFSCRAPSPTGRREAC